MKSDYEYYKFYTHYVNVYYWINIFTAFTIII